MTDNGTDIIDRLVTEWQIERPDLDANSMHVVGRLIKLGKTLEKRAGEALKDSKIHYTDLDVLATIKRSGKPYKLTPKELMKSVLITSGAMTTLLDRLTKLSLIYRESDEQDGRIKRACLTKKGEKVIDKAIEIRFKEATHSISVLSEDDIPTLTLILKKLMVSLNK